MKKATQGNNQIKENQYWTKQPKELFSELTTGENGLSENEAKSKIESFGPNSLKGKNSSSAFFLFLGQFKSPITLILIAAAILSLLLQDKTDAIIILLIVMISSCLGFWQEYGASNAVARLLKMVQVTVKVLRDGKETQLPTESIVPGDVVVLSAGDIIPADCILLTSQELFVDEAAFTGESFPVEKQVGVLDEDTPVAKRSNMLFMGSHVISGKASVVVVSTGMGTEFGKISNRLRLNTPETEFEKGIKKFGFMLMQITLILILIIFALNVLLHKPVLDSFLFSLALAVGLTPQLLPVIITVNLSTGAKKMAAQQVIVKRLAAIENFGSMNILCSDKTGTITQGKVKLYKVFGYNGEENNLVNEYALYNASLQQGFKNPIDEAIIDAFQSDNQELPKLVDEIPYDFIRKRLSIVVKLDGQLTFITKGAFQEVLSVCSQVQTEKDTILPLSEDKKKTLIKLYEDYSKDGYRTLGICWKHIDTSSISKEDENNMTFLGFVTFFDPPKESAVTAIANLEKLGVKLKIITGDNALVAESLAKQVGIANPIVVKGSSLRKNSSDALAANALQADIFCRSRTQPKRTNHSGIEKIRQCGWFYGRWN